MKKKIKTLWIGLCRDYKVYAVQTSKDGWDKDIGWGVSLTCLCPEEFESTTGIKLKPGECKEFILKEVKR